MTKKHKRAKYSPKHQLNINRNTNDEQCKYIQETPAVTLSPYQSNNYEKPDAK